MSYKSILTNKTPINQFFLKLSFFLYFSKPVLKHIEQFINASVCKGYNGTVTDIVGLSLANCHRTTYGKFLSESVFKTEVAWKALKKFQIDLIYNNSSSSEPVFVIYDDTIAEKTKPSSQAKNTIQQADFHYSHLDRKKVFGHQLFTTVLSCKGMVLPYSVERYEKGKRSKIQMLCDVVKELPKPKTIGYGLCDSWFTNKKVINAHFEKGYHLIGALKTNRVIYPKGIGIQIKDFAKYIKEEDCCLVTVNKSKYLVYRYEGKLNGIDNAVVLLCYKEDQFKVNGALHAFLCTDTELDTKTILEYYSKRWPIEIFFKQTKGNLGLNSYQVRSKKAIDRILLLICLSYTYCVTLEGSNNSFSKGLNVSRNNIKKDHIQMIYDYAKNGLPIETIFKIMKVA